MTWPSAVLLILLAACSADPGSGAAGSALSTRTTVAVNAGPPALSVPPHEPARSISTVPWDSVRLDAEKPLEAAIPVRIQIAVIELEAPILPLGAIPDTGQMEVPENVEEVGWYRYGPAPGSPGSAVLAAHVDMAGEGPGVFFHLDRLRIGDQIVVDFEDGTTSTFVVSRADRVAKGELDFASVFSPVGEPLLRLVTCGGGFNRTTRSYDDNFVVTAHPLLP